jgi:hypothetical protein
MVYIDILPNKEGVDATVPDLFEETCLTLTTVDDLTLLSGASVRVFLVVNKVRHVIVRAFG